MKKLILFISLIAVGAIWSCSDKFLDVKPIASLDPTTLQNRQGVEALLVGAYSLLDGIGAGTTAWHGSGDNWIYGSVAADDAYKGTNAGDQPEITFIETYNILPDNNHFRGKWRAVYDGVARSNDVLQALEKASDVNETDRARLSAEARFLRGHYHFEAKKMFNKVPYIDEKIYDPTNAASTKVPNNENIWPKIEADFQYAYENLPATQTQLARATKWAAAAMLAKAYLFQKKFAEAKPLLEAIVASNQFKLVDRYQDNFKASTNNNQESIFEVQHSVNDGASGGQNGNNGAVLNYPYTGPWNCCGFFQPSQNLVNAYKTDPVTGLPMLDTFNDEDVKNDQGLEAKDPFTPYTGSLDPRLDWTVGRRGIPYLDYGPHPGKTYVRDQAYAGPYSPKKHVFYKSDIGANVQANGRNNANNYRMVRYSHVLLWLAEIETELGNLEMAREYVNQIRRRAAKPESWVKNDDGTPAANYVINEYTLPWTDADFARKAIRFEHRLEFAMEGHRYFDLVRWGIAAQTLNNYVAKEKNKRSYLNGAVFKEGVHEYYPVPLQEILNSAKSGQPTLEQNPGY